MELSDLILDVFKIEDEEPITEQGLLITPLLAFSALKKKVLGKGKDKGPGLIKIAKAKGKEFKEKAKATVGQTSGKGGGATVYRFTKEQLDVMSDIMARYGREIVKEIIDFRRQILAPYALIKRQVKGSSRVTSKDKFGMTREEFKSSLESGRKKIEARGESYWDKSKELQEKIKRYSDQLEGLNAAENNFDSGTELSPNITNKIYKQFGVGSEGLRGYTPEELQSVYRDIEKNYQDIIDQLEKTKRGEGDSEEAIKLTKKARELRSGKSIEPTKSKTEKSIDLTKIEKEDFYIKGNFNSALGAYFFRREILNKLRPGQNNTFRDTYKSIITEMKKSIISRKKESVHKLASMKKTVDFNEKEEKIWKKLPTVKSFSGNIKDYYQDVKEDDFGELPQYIERSPKLKEAEQKIENEIRRFERKLQKIISSEDYAKLKKYRVINNLIAVRELKDPSSLFKSTDEIKSLGSSTTKDDDKPEEKEKEEDYLSPDEFERKIKEIVKREYDSVRELNNAKREMEDLFKQMEDQDDKDKIKRFKDIRRTMKIRRTLKSQDIKGHGVDRDIIVDVDDIEKLSRKIINKNYVNIDLAKQDFARLKGMIAKYKEDNPRAEKNLQEIDFLINRVNIKLQREVR